MCGLVGIINVAKIVTPLKTDVFNDLEKAMKVQAHRGPDDQGVCGFSFSSQKTYSVDNVSKLEIGLDYDGFVGFNRLSIRDLTAAGHQPMTGALGKVVLVFNGEIYNDATLRKELQSRGYLFKGRSDTEVILNLYLEYGFEKMISCLNGMFAISIIDLRIGKIFMARDRYGIKPLYYSFCNGKVFFASELKSIVQFRDFSKKIDVEALNERLIFSRPSNAVLLSNVEILNPGQAITISKNEGYLFWNFYDINNHVRDVDKYDSINEVLEEAEYVLSDVVERQMLSDVKVGTQLSGGIDSTVVSFFANKVNRNKLNDGISIIDDDGVNGEEFYMNQVGDVLDLNVHKYKIDPNFYAENYKNTIWFNDAPVYSPFFANHLKIAEKAKDHVTVTLSGEGADELGGGYNRFATGVYQPFISGFGCNSKNLKCYNSYAEYAVMSDATNIGLKLTDFGETQNLIQKQIDVFNSFTGSDFTKQIKFEMTQRLPDGLMRQDKMNMAYSVENRVPLLDNKFVDFVMQLPENMLLRFKDESPVTLSNNPFEWTVGKFFLKELCARKFGNDFAYRKKKIMVLDKRQMLSFDGFKTLFYDLIYPRMKNRGIINVDLIEKFYRNVKSVSESEFNAMWRAMSSEMWCQLFLDVNYTEN